MRFLFCTLYYTYMKKGFSLIELLTVIAIIGILSTIVIGSTSASRARARDDKRFSDIKSIQLALALYYDVNKIYPQGSTVTALRNTLVTDKYMAEIPKDPSGVDYEYNGVTSPLKAYCLGAKLEIAPLPNDNSACTNISTTGWTATYKVSR